MLIISYDIVPDQAILIDLYHWLSMTELDVVSDIYEIIGSPIDYISATYGVVILLINAMVMDFII